MRRLVVVLLFALAGLAAFLAFCGAPESEHTKSANSLNDGVFRTVVLGDSVARGAGDEKRLGLPGRLDHEFHTMGFTADATLNLGINSGRTYNVKHLLRQPRATAVVARADVIVISLGGNDLYGDPQARLLTGIWPWYQRSRTLKRVEQVVHLVRQMNPSARIYLLGLYNPYQRTSRGPWIDTQVNLWDAGLIRRFADMPEVTVIRIADLLVRTDRISPIDHFHPGSLGYAAIARRIADTF
jgi:lysophospholipase L1-like esterase